MTNNIFFSQEKKEPLVKRVLKLCNTFPHTVYVSIYHITPSSAAVVAAVARYATAAWIALLKVQRLSLSLSYSLLLSLIELWLILPLLQYILLYFIFLFSLTQAHVYNLYANKASAWLPATRKTQLLSFISKC